VEGYCMKDKRMVEMKDPQAVTMKNGKPATRGVCPNCGTTIFQDRKAKRLGSVSANHIARAARFQSGPFSCPLVGERRLERSEQDLGGPTPLHRRRAS